VDNQEVDELVSGVVPEQLEHVAGLDLFVVRNGSDRPTLLEVNGKIQGICIPWPSPDGRYVAIQTFADRSNIPLDWFDYQLVAQQTILSKHGTSTVNQYELVDLTTRKSNVLIDAPVGAWYSNIAWSSDGRSVFVSGTNLPLNVADSFERKFLEQHLFVANVSVPDGVITPITPQDAIIRYWDAKANKLVVQLTNRYSFSNFEEGRVVAFRRTDDGWNQEELSEDPLHNRLQVSVEEDMNMPPQLFAKEMKTNTKALLLDLNPQFANLKFGHVEEIKFKSADGHPMKVGIYRPADYSSGKRYPLVIQTHGWTSDRFWIDGPDPNAMAAQILASKEFVVAQIGDEFSFTINTPNEGKFEMAEFDNVVDYLDTIGLIDPNRVGIVGFSATGPGVGYAITHSKYHFRAAVLSETNDAGYFTYVSFLNVAGTKERFEPMNGGVPFGVSLDSWIREAPEFSLDKVNTAMLLQPNGPGSLLGLWEWFVGFRRLGRPVEMIFMPDAGHVATRPEDRIISQGTAVDWFTFWLKGEEDSDPAKAEQYKRWREMRKLQDKNKAAGDKSLAPMN
jgi:dipeptidyl aminopeptidase/acylaminoacyl peptidase